jgi:hypothetical protein
MPLNVESLLTGPLTVPGARSSAGTWRTSPRRFACLWPSCCFGQAMGSAVAQQPACGQVVTTDERLDQNLVCPPSTGLIVGAHGPRST